MARNAFKMKLKPGCVAEYKRRHDEIWPELARAHSDAGISDYSIYYDDQTETLFAYQRLKEGCTTEKMRNLDIVRKWWDFNKDLMETLPDNEPVCTSLREVFHMD